MAERARGEAESRRTLRLYGLWQAGGGWRRLGRAAKLPRLPTNASPRGAVNETRTVYRGRHALRPHHRHVGLRGVRVGAVAGGSSRFGTLEFGYGDGDSLPYKKGL